MLVLDKPLQAHAGITLILPACQKLSFVGCGLGPALCHKRSDIHTMCALEKRAVTVDRLTGLQLPAHPWLPLQF